MSKVNQDTVRLYSAATAKKLLGGISYTALNRYVASGAIQKKTLQGKKYGYYVASDVDALAGEINQYEIVKESN